MKKSYALLAFLLLTILYSSAKAQKNDYIINVKGDTINCSFTASVLGSSEYLKYRTDTLTGFKKFDPDYVKAYHRADDEYVHHLVFRYDLKTLEYLERLNSGRISLFRGYEASGQFIHDVWYVQKSPQEFVVPIKARTLFANEKKAKRYFISLIADQPLVERQFNNADSFSFDTIKRIITLYNTAKFVNNFN